MRNLKIFFIGVIFVSLAAAVLLERHTQAKLRDNKVMLQQQDHQFAELEAENQRLSDLHTQAKTNCALADDRTTELAQLRTKAEALRKQTNQLAQLAKRLAEDHRRAGAQFFASRDSHLFEHNKAITGSMPGGPRVMGKLNDARALTAALNQFADDHQGKFALSLDQVTPYLPKALDSNSRPWANAPLSGTNDFEIVFQGSQDDLSNIPLRRVALIRERQPWQTPDGNWARTYGYADGDAMTIQSDDNFQSWDAQNIIPSQADGQ